MRSYFRTLPDLYERKAFGTKEHPPYPAAAIVCFLGVLCFGEQQPERGRFKSRRVLVALLEGPQGKGRTYARQVGFLIAQRDLVELADGSLYIEGWDELQEGNWQVADRMQRYRSRDGRVPMEKSPGAVRTANWRLRTQVFERDNYTCRYCGNAGYERDWLVLEHVIPDGPSTEDNLVTACRPCNKQKGGRTPEEAGMGLLAVMHHGDTFPLPSSDASLVQGCDVTTASRVEANSEERIAEGVARTRAREATERAESWLAAHGAMRGELTAGLSGKLADLIARHGETAVLAAFEAMAGEGITAREYVFGAENDLNTKHLRSKGKQEAAIDAERFEREVAATKARRARLSEPRESQNELAADASAWAAGPEEATR